MSKEIRGLKSYVFGLISASYIFLRSFIGGILGINMAIQWEWIIKWFYIIFLGAKPEIEENEVTQGQNRGLVDRSFEIIFGLVFIVIYRYIQNR